MVYKVTLIRGDGTGPEIMDACLNVLEATGIKFQFDETVIGINALEQFGNPLPQDAIDKIKASKLALKSPCTTPVGEGFRSVNVGLRQELDLYACLRPCKSYEGNGMHYKDVDLVVVRENTEDLYAGVEHWIDSEHSAAESIKIITRKASERIARWAFEYARKHGRKKVTAVHKANIMKFSDGLFLESARNVAAKYPDIIFEDRIVDNMCMQLVKKPNEYDVMVLPNLYGDIVSDLCAGLVGGLGVAPGANIGDEIAVFEATHGSAPKYAGQNKVNPTSLILSAMLMLQHIGEMDAARKIEEGVAHAMKTGQVTYDLDGKLGTKEMAEVIAKYVREH